MTEFISPQTEATHFETMMTAVNEVTSDVTKDPDKFIFRSVSVVCVDAETRCAN